MEIPNPKRTNKTMFTGLVAVLAVGVLGILFIVTLGACLLWSLGVLGIVSIPVTPSAIGAVALLVAIFFGLVAGLKAL